ncbi:hypothetical protein Saa2_03199 [Streptomyces acidiscabies]|nr:hypothetical protein Saa2_03199 [Streptomyces acidiscabies]
MSFASVSPIVTRAPSGNGRTTTPPRFGTTPSSVTVNRTRPEPPVNSIAQFLAPLCRTMLVTASRTTQPRRAAV